MRNCGNCGSPGHNRRTCPEGKTTKPKAKGRACGHCGELGHNKRTCPELQVEEVEEEVVEVVPEKPKKKKRTQRCKLCKEENDHKAADCPYKAIPDDAVLGPTKMDCGHFTWWLTEEGCERCSRMSNLKGRDYAE